MADEEQQLSEESKIETRKTVYEPLKRESEVFHKNWEINLKDKMNLKNYTKRNYNVKPRNKQKKTNSSLAVIHNLQNVTTPVEADRVMKEINLQKDFELDYPELLTKYEFPAVLRLKKKFMVWFCNHMHEKIQQKKREIDDKKLQKEEKERLNKAKEEEEADTKALKDESKEEIISTKMKTEQLEALDIDNIDPLEENPSSILKCAF